LKRKKTVCVVLGTFIHSLVQLNQKKARKKALFLLLIGDVDSQFLQIHNLDGMAFANVGLLAMHGHCLWCF
jgi:hypothetical protein